MPYDIVLQLLDASFPVSNYKTYIFILKQYQILLLLLFQIYCFQFSSDLFIDGN